MLSMCTLGHQTPSRPCHVLAVPSLALRRIPQLHAADKPTRAQTPTHNALTPTPTLTLTPSRDARRAHSQTCTHAHKQLQHFSSETEVIRYGESGDCMYFISKGRVEVLGADGKVCRLLVMPYAAMGYALSLYTISVASPFLPPLPLLLLLLCRASESCACIY